MCASGTPHTDGGRQTTGGGDGERDSRLGSGGVTLFGEGVEWKRGRGAWRKGHVSSWEGRRGQGGNGNGDRDRDGNPPSLLIKIHARHTVSSIFILRHICYYYSALYPIKLQGSQFQFNHINSDLIVRKDGFNGKLEVRDT